MHTPRDTRSLQELNTGRAQDASGRGGRRVLVGRQHLAHRGAAGRPVPLALVGLCALLALHLARVPTARADERDREVAQHVETLEDFATNADEQGARETAIRKLAALGGKRAAAGLLPALADDFEHIRDHAASAYVALLSSNEAEDVLSWMRKKGLRHRDPRVRAGLYRALGSTGGPTATRMLFERLAKERAPEALAVAFRICLRIPRNEGWNKAFARHLGHREAEVAYWCARACAHHGGRAHAQDLATALRKEGPLARAGAVQGLCAAGLIEAAQIEAALADEAVAVRVALALASGAAGPLAGEPGQRVLARLIEDTSWRVRSAAVQSVMQRWTPDGVGLLIGRLPKEDGRLRGDIHRALRTLTGADVPLDPVQWTAWWRGASGRFEMPSQPKRLDSGRVPYREASEAAKAGRTAAFVEMPIYSKRIAFVFDLSGSMRYPLKKTNPETKLDWLRRQFEAAVTALPEDVVFDLYVYRYWSGYPPKPQMTRAFEALSPANPKHIKAARKWMARQEPKGWGAFYEPMTQIFAEDVDTIILLSDGAPSRGRLDRGFRIVEEFPVANALHQVAVDTVFIGTKKKDRNFMRALSRCTGGRFKDVLGK